LWAFNLVNKINFVEIKIYHKFSKLDYAFMLKHILFCDDCFWFAFFSVKILLKKTLGKQNIKEIRNKKKKEKAPW